MYFYFLIDQTNGVQSGNWMRNKKQRKILLPPGLFLVNAVNSVVQDWAWWPFTSIYFNTATFPRSVLWERAKNLLHPENGAPLQTPNYNMYCNNFLSCTVKDGQSMVYLGKLFILLSRYFCEQCYMLQQMHSITEIQNAIRHSGFSLTIPGNLYWLQTTRAKLPGQMQQGRPETRYW